VALAAAVGIGRFVYTLFAPDGRGTWHDAGDRRPSGLSQLRRLPWFPSPPLASREKPMLVCSPIGERIPEQAMPHRQWRAMCSTWSDSKYLPAAEVW
jgi:hypothetical protein